MTVSRPAKLVVVSAPSGTGKTTVCTALVRRSREVAISISYTTRAPRGSERDGVEYHFVDDARFDRLIAEGAFLEWAHVHQRRYGTARADTEALLAAGKDVLFDIDVQGGQQIKRAMPDATLLVFVLPPSIDELVRRLTGRGTESVDQVAGRLRTAIWELEQGLEYECHLVNDQLTEAVAALDRVRAAPMERARQLRMDDFLRRLLDETSRKLAEID